MTTTMLHKLNHAARFSFSPVFSLFRTSYDGEYSLIVRTKSVDEVIARFRLEANRQLEMRFVGLEIRCDGVRVNLS